MASYLSALPALQTQVPDIGPGVNYLASIPDQIRQDRMEDEKVSLLRQATEMKQEEFTVDMGNKVGECAFKAGSLADTPEKWEQFRSTLSPYTQKYGLPDPGDFNGRESFLAAGAPLFDPNYIKKQELAQGPKLPSSFTEYQISQQDPKYREFLDVKSGKADKRDAAQYRRDTLTSELSRLRETALQIKSHPGLSAITGGMGPFGLIPREKVMNYPGGDAANAEALLTTLKSQVGFNVLQAMRQASQTGGALGQVAVQELIMLQNNLAALDQQQSPDALATALQQIADHADAVIGRMQTAYSSDVGETQDAAPNTSIVTKPSKGVSSSGAAWSAICCKAVA